VVVFWGLCADCQVVRRQHGYGSATAIGEGVTA
jgi:hypothetical protein